MNNFLLRDFTNFQNISIENRDFFIRKIVSAKEKVVNQDTILLSLEGQKNLAKLLNSPSKPTKEMEQLRNMPRLKVRE